MGWQPTTALEGSWVYFLITRKVINDAIAPMPQLYTFSSRVESFIIHATTSMDRNIISITYIKNLVLCCLGWSPMGTCVLPPHNRGNAGRAFL